MRQSCAQSRGAGRQDASRGAQTKHRQMGKEVLSHLLKGGKQANNAFPLRSP